jgi:hypothetical protein
MTDPGDTADTTHNTQAMGAEFVCVLSERVRSISGDPKQMREMPGKIPDRRVAISAVITTPSATTVTSGDVRFIVFRPDGGVDASGTEVRVVAKVSRAMGVDATEKASMVNASDSWVIRSTSFPYKVAPVEDQPRMLLLQPEQDGFALAPAATSWSSKTWATTLPSPAT